MSQIFLRIINMSISASYIVLAVLLLRSLLKKAPKWITVLLWGVVAVRLICPFSIESVLSLIPSAEVISPNIMVEREPAIHTGISVVNQAINPIIGSTFAPDPTASANPLQIWIPVLALIWLIGMVGLVIYMIISYAGVKRRVGMAVLFRDNIYQSENVVSPFVLGVVKPKIYLPFHMDERDREHVVSHEMAHIHRRDHLWKPLGFLLLALHWFNPLMLLGYVLLCRDIELACDEKVIGALDHEARADYSQALLTCSVNRRMIAACPLAFGEVGVKDRIKSVLNYKKPALWIIIVSLVLCVVLAVCFLTVPREKEGEGTTKPGITDEELLTFEQRYLMEQHPEFFGLDASKGLDVYVCQFAPQHYSFRLLEHSETEPINFMVLSSMGGIDAASMRLILETYEVTREDVTVIPWQNPLSSYIGSYQLIPEDGNIEEVRAEYKEMILDMLFGQVELSVPVYDSMQFDVDGDGKIEHCILGFGMTSGRFSFTFSASEVTTGVNTGDWKKEYHNVIYSAWYKLSFVQCEDGVVRVQGIDREDKVHLFDISIVDGIVYLSENGIPISEFAGSLNFTYSLLYSNPTLSWVLNQSEVPYVTIKDGVLYQKEGLAHIYIGDREATELYLKLGTVTETTTEQTDFKNLEESYNGTYAELVKGILENNDKIYQVNPDDKEGVALYYVMFQKDGSTILVYGHYENGEKTDFIRWIFQLG